MLLRVLWAARSLRAALRGLTTCLLYRRGLHPAAPRNMRSSTETGAYLGLPYLLAPRCQHHHRCAVRHSSRGALPCSGLCARSCRLDAVFTRHDFASRRLAIPAYEATIIEQFPPCLPITSAELAVTARLPRCSLPAPARSLTLPIVLCIVASFASSSG